MADKTYKIIRHWASNNQPNNCTINIPSEFVKQYELLKVKFLIARSVGNGILIQPLKEVDKAE